MSAHSAVYVLGAARTPMGSFQGSLAQFSAPQLGAHAIRAAIEQSGLPVSAIDEVIMGNVVSAGLKQAPARQAMRQAGLPDSCGATTVNKVCGSGMKASMLATDLIRAGSARVVLAGGMESMTNAPYLMPKARSGLRMGHTEVKDAMFLDGLEDAETGQAMGLFAQNTADDYQFTREQMDAYATRSVQRALSAAESGCLEAEISSLSVSRPRDETTRLISQDEPPMRADIAKIPKLRPAFKEGGSVTAANSSSIADGASALVLAGSEYVQQGSLTPMAEVVGHATFSRHPSEFTIAPVGAIEKLLQQLSWDTTDVDLFEINEAFAMVTMIAIRDLGLDVNQVNVWGGACAQGHPIGSTGSRLIVTLAHAMQQLDKKRGIAALCIGGGEATAIALERR